MPAMGLLNITENVVLTSEPKKSPGSHLSCCAHGAHYACPSRATCARCRWILPNDGKVRNPGAYLHVLSSSLHFIDGFSMVNRFPVRLIPLGKALITPFDIVKAPAVILIEYFGIPVEIRKIDTADKQLIGNSDVLHFTIV